MMVGVRRDDGRRELKRVDRRNGCTSKPRGRCANRIANPPSIAPGSTNDRIAHRPLVLWRRSRVYCALTIFPTM
jgi:hypothetical protein